MKKTAWLRWVACGVFACVFLYSGWQLLSYYTQQKTAQGEYESLQAAVSTAAPTTTVTGNDDAPAPSRPTGPIAVNFDSVRATAPDAVGWLYIPDTPINYPVVQGADNDAYIDRLPNGKQNKAGSLFADYRNLSPQDANYIIYGHSMKTGAMFGMLEHYAKQAYYDAHPLAYYLTPEAVYILHIYAGYTTDASSEAYTLSHTAVSLAEYMAQAKKQSDFRTEVPFYPGDTVITLSTCAYDYEDARYVLLCIPERVE